jgi:hypothetical protein
MRTQIGKALDHAPGWDDSNLPETLSASRAARERRVPQARQLHAPGATTR